MTLPGVWKVGFQEDIPPGCHISEIMNRYWWFKRNAFKYWSTYYFWVQSTMSNFIHKYVIVVSSTRCILTFETLMSIRSVLQGSHMYWKTWKNIVHLENLEKSWNFAKNIKNHGNIMEFCQARNVGTLKWYIFDLVKLLCKHRLKSNWRLH